MTAAEFSQDVDKQLKWIVYAPEFLEPAVQQAETALDKFKPQWDNPLHVILAAFLLPAVVCLFLAEVVFSEKDVTSWVDGTILQPALIGLRLMGASQNMEQVEVHEFELANLPEHPSLSCPPSERINPDRVVLKEVIWRLAGPEGKGKKIEHSTEDAVHAAEQGEPIYLLTLGFKTQKVLKEKLFSDIFQMPMDHRKGSHTMRFVWPKELSQQNDKETRIIIQIWSQMTNKNISCAMARSVVKKAKDFHLSILIMWKKRTSDGS
ncbi:hypothetical protein C8Q74DRAFT_1363870 [Fomes fomentarius]|nr:hypothetical protein C8Q74DRAFT_1363870 [Fomes fomentarius]